MKPLQFRTLDNVFISTNQSLVPAQINPVNDADFQDYTNMMLENLQYLLVNGYGAHETIGIIHEMDEIRAFQVNVHNVDVLKQMAGNEQNPYHVKQNERAISELQKDLADLVAEISIQESSDEGVKTCIIYSSDHRAFNLAIAVLACRKGIESTHFEVLRKGMKPELLKEKFAGRTNDPMIMGQIADFFHPVEYLPVPSTLIEEYFNNGLYRGHPKIEIQLAPKASENTHGLN